LSDVFKLVREKIEQEQPELVNKMTTTLGFVFTMSKLLFIVKFSKMI